jgi:hypothetical protein
MLTPSLRKRKNFPFDPINIYSDLVWYLQALSQCDTTAVSNINYVTWHPFLFIKREAVWCFGVKFFLFLLVLVVLGLFHTNTVSFFVRSSSQGVKRWFKCFVARTANDTPTLHIIFRKFFSDKCTLSQEIFITGPWNVYSVMDGIWEGTRIFEDPK